MMGRVVAAGGCAAAVAAACGIGVTSAALWFTTWSPVPAVRRVGW